MGKEKPALHRSFQEKKNLQPNDQILKAQLTEGRHGGLMVSALDSGASAPGSSPGRGHCVVFLGKTLYSHSASQMGTGEFNAGG